MEAINIGRNSSILLISNGYGEDIIGSKILQEFLKKRDNINDIFVLPVVGEGKAYKSLNVELVGPVSTLPSGGFARNSLNNLFKDLKAGLLSLTFRQIKAVRKYGKKADLIIVVGDIYILTLAGMFGGDKIIFLPTAKSEYINGHYQIEKMIMKKFATIVFPRDKKTANNLQQYGINAKYIGNMMMDCFQVKDVDFFLEDKSRVVGLLPGSRDEAYDNFLFFLKIIEKVEKICEINVEYITAMARNLSLKKLKDKIEKTNWQVQNLSQKEKNSGIKMIINYPSGKSKIKIIYHHFGDVLDKAEVFIGQAGTANEQAVGMGKPVIIFPGTGSQFTKKFAGAQKSLLGDSVKFVKRRKPDKIAQNLIKILKNKEVYQKMSQTGKKRMGNSGGIKNLVDFLF